MAVRPPSPDPQSTANFFWTILDKHIQNAIQGFLNQWGTPRSRILTINFPLAGDAGPPSTGWVASCGVGHNIKVVGWMVNAIVPGTVSLQIQQSSVQADPGDVPSYTEMTNTPISHSGYTTFSNDTSDWNTTFVSGGSFVHVFITASGDLQEATLALRVIDQDSKTIGQ